MKKLLSLIVIALFSFMATAQISQTINITDAGTLSTLASDYLSTVTNLTVTGNIDARDVKCMRDQMPLLAVLDMSGVSIVAYTGTEGTVGTSLTTYPANEMPSNSFLNPLTDSGKTSLKTITLSTTLISIGDYAFNWCTGLTDSLTIPNSVTTIKGYAFQNCSGISSLILGNSVSYIKINAFIKCPSLKLIYCLNPVPPTLENGVFTEWWILAHQYTLVYSSNVTDVFVPSDAAVTAYKASCWSSCFHSPFPGNIIKTETVTAVNDLSLSKIRVYPTAGGISIEGLDAGEKLTLYTVNGVQLQTLKSEGTLTILPALPKAVYLVKTAGKVFKVIL